MAQVKNEIFVHIKKEKGSTRIDWSYKVLMLKEEQGMKICYIPGFDIYFSATNDDMASKKATDLTVSFFDHFMLHIKKRGLATLTKKMSKMGFKPDVNKMKVMSSLLKNKPINSKFVVDRFNTPVGFENAESIHHQHEMELAG